MFKYFFAVFLFLFTCASAQVNSTRLEFNPQKIVPGSSLELIYHKSKGSLDNSKAVKVAIYQFNDYKWQTDTALTSAAGSDCTVTFKILPNTAFLAFRFYQGSFNSPDNVDHNDEKGFTKLITVKKDKMVPGGALAKALFNIPANKGGLAGYFEAQHNVMSTDSLQILLDQELKQKGSSPAKFVREYLSIQRIIKGEHFNNEAPAILGQLLASKDLSEQGLSEILRVYQFELKDQENAGKVKMEIISRYPQGATARLEAYQQLLSQSQDKAKVIPCSQKFLSDFPIEEWRKHPDSQGYIYYGVYRNLAVAYFDKGDYSALLQLQKDWDFKTENEIFRWNVVRAYLSKQVAPSKLQPFADSLFVDLRKKINDGSFNGDFATAELAHENALAQLDLRTADQINIHYRNGDYKGALSYYEYLPHSKLYESASLNALHLEMLDKTDQKQFVTPLLQESVKANAVTPAMFERLKQIYVEQHGNLTGYEQYLSSLKSADEISELKSSVMANMINHDFVPFALEDLNGKTVRSSEWGNKIVVVDFWATWCRPCIESFPGMQMLVDKYAKDPNVDFYFISTMQTGDYKQKVVNFMKKNAWRFKVLNDGINERSGAQNSVFSTFAPFFNSSGIPRKVILKNGVIRYTTEGYSGSPSQLADEMSYAIDILKAEK